jgi:hypothetical protein
VVLCHELSFSWVSRVALIAGAFAAFGFPLGCRNHGGTVTTHALGALKSATKV